MLDKTGISWPFIILLVLFFQSMTITTANSQAVMCADPDQFEINVLENLEGAKAKGMANEIMVSNDELRLEGDAEILVPNGRISSDEIIYDASGFFEAKGKVEFEHPNALIRTEDLYIDVYDVSNEIENLQLKVFDTDEATSKQRTFVARAVMERVSYEYGVTTLHGAVFSNCPENNDDVILSAKSIEFNKNTGFGKARSALVKFKGVPIVYSPILIFPIDNVRRSGVLFPRIGYNSTSGLTTAIPYYLNMAPNFDATVSPNIMTERGVQLQTEFRHASKYSDTVLDIEHISKDRAVNFDDAREAIVLNSNFHDQARYYANVQAGWVSDDTYIDSFDRLFGDEDTYYLNQSAVFSTVGSDYKTSIGADQFSTAITTLTDSDLPYDRLPWAKIEKSFDLGTNTEWTTEFNYDKFDHKTKPTGERVRVDSYLELEQSLDVVSVKHKLGGELIDVQVDENTSKGYTALSESTTAGYYSIDVSMKLDQISNGDLNSGRWTLEPKFRLTYADEQDQSELPNFDTELPNYFNFFDLFSDKMYVGGDRVRDTSQIGLGVMASYISASNPDYVTNVGVGRIEYPSFQNTNLSSANALENRESFNLLAVKLQRDYWRQQASFLFDEGFDHIEQSIATVSYAISPKQQVTGLYKYIYEEDEQVGGIYTHQLTHYASLNVEHTTSLGDSSVYDTTVILDYDSCCWGANIEYERSINQVGVAEDSVNLVFDLTGLISN